MKSIKTPVINKDTQIVVEYTCTLNSNAVIGSNGNPNTVYLTYSNNPNHDGGGETGHTPKDTVIVFTYKVTANKVDESNEALPGAAFTLYKNYKGTDPLPTGKTAVTEIKYNNNKNSYSIADDDKWVVVDTTEAGTATTFSFERIDDGDYLLVETTTPNGYNAVEPMKFTVTATHTEGETPELTELKGGDKFTGDLESGNLTTSVENKQGTTLPETGGIGTTMFYIIGSAMVLGAGIILTSKMRANN